MRHLANTRVITCLTFWCLVLWAATTTAAVWLETAVNGETLSPRQPIVSVGYAFRADYANNVDDADADATNELNTTVTFDNLSSVLTITDAGGAKTVDLSRLTRADPPCFDTNNRYVDCGNGTVTDTVTGLIWLKNANCFGRLTWAKAGNAAAGLQHGECGLTDNSLPGDWRLPTRAEWKATIAHADALGCTNPILTDTPGTGCYSSGPQPFTSVQLNYYYYWSGTALESIPNNAWFMNVSFGYVVANVKMTTYYVWPVR